MSKKPIVALTLRPQYVKELFTSADMARLNELAQVLGPAYAAEDPELHGILQDAAVAIGCWGSSRFDAALLKHAGKLRLFAYAAGSVKGLVSDALFERGIRVCTAADAMAPFVAEYTVAMMESLLKQAPWLGQLYPGDLQGQSEEFQNRWAHMRELYELEVGIIGASRVGRQVIRLLKGYQGLRIKVYDPYLSVDGARQLGVQRYSLDEICRCEVVSCHAPSIAATRHMLNAATLALLPDHAVLINTSRGALVDEAALVAEVRRRPLYVLLDVTDPEPPEASSPLLRERNIILTPHVAGAVGQGHHALGRMAIEETLRFLRGQELQHEVTREMLATQA